MSILETRPFLTHYLPSVALLSSQTTMGIPARVTRSLFVDGTPVGRGVIAFGLDGLIIPASSTTVMKIPKLGATMFPDGSLKPVKDNIWQADSLEVEKEVYRRLHGVKGLANCLNISRNGLELEYYQQGTLEDHIKNNSPPPWTQRLEWKLQLIDFVAACHDRKVLWFDIALRNILLADDWTIRAIDFANSTAEPLGADLMRQTLMAIQRKWRCYTLPMSFIRSLAGTSFKSTVWRKTNGR
jgi:hypothetical protein